jgi:hypothetical protein
VEVLEQKHVGVFRLLFSDFSDFLILSRGLPPFGNGCQAIGIARACFDRFSKCALQLLDNQALIPPFSGSNLGAPAIDFIEESAFHR